MSNDSILPEVTLAQAGEAAVLAAILPLLPPAPRGTLGPGDDSAVLLTPDGRVVISCDMMIEGPDFRLDWSTPEDVGFKAIASNAADIAAMGATATAFEIAVAAPGSTSLSTLLQLAKGFALGIGALAPEAGVIGGDLSQAPVMTIAITVLGDLASRAPITRTGARLGDVVAVAGELGLSHRGYRALWEAQGDVATIAQLRATNEAVMHHLRPHPPLHCGLIAAAAGATAMMDISDGLVVDATRMARASGVAIELVGELATDDDALFGGEDHSLLATFTPGTALPRGFRPIGMVVGWAPGMAAVTVPGRDVSTQTGGWDPFVHEAT